MSGRLAGRVALVTGGLSGIGAACAKRLAREGACVIAADIAAAAADLGARPIAPAHLDVSNPDSVAALIEAIGATHGRLDIVVNSAGVAANLPFLDTPVDTFDRIMGVNLRGTFLVGQAAVGLMADGGAIVNIASISALRANAGRAAYGASKAGVVLLTQVMAVELAARRIRVNAVAPGPVETPMIATMAADAARAAWYRLVPQRRFAAPEEVAASVTFLCSVDATYVTGHVLQVDGGFCAAGL
jgi:NAD(P)-dependent dehydrogenase (short-subunit alcohol dehydrogenase family)